MGGELRSAPGCPTLAHRPNEEIVLREGEQEKRLIFREELLRLAKRHGRRLDKREVIREISGNALIGLADFSFLVRNTSAQGGGIFSDSFRIGEKQRVREALVGSPPFYDKILLMAQEFRQCPWSLGLARRHLCQRR